MKTPSKIKTGFQIALDVFFIILFLAAGIICFLVGAKIGETGEETKKDFVLYLFCCLCPYLSW